MKAPTSMIPSSSATSLYVLCKGSITANATTGAFWMLHIIIYTCVMEVLAQKSKQKYHKSQKQIIARIPDDLPQKHLTNYIKNAKLFTSNIINEISQKLQLKNVENLKSFCYLIRND